MLKHFSITPPENSGGAEKSPENSGSHAKNFFCSMYEMSQRHPVWVAENHVNPCNSVDLAGFIFRNAPLIPNRPHFHPVMVVVEEAQV